MDNTGQIEIEKKDGLKWWDGLIPFLVFTTAQIISGFIALILIFALDWRILLNTIKSNTNSTQISNILVGKYSIIFGITVLFSFALTALFIVFYIRFRKLRLSTIGFKKFLPVFFLYIIGFNLSFFLVSYVYDSILGVLGLKANAQLNDYINMFGKDFFGLVLLGFTIVIAAPLIEEVVFRGFLFGYLDLRFGFLKAAIVSSLVFALVHLYFVQLPMFFLIGFGFAYLMKRSGSIWPAILAHCANNAVLFVIMVLIIGEMK